MAEVTIELAGRPYAVAPYKFGDMRKAAPHIDRMNELMKRVSELEKAKEDPGLELLSDLLHELVAILAIGLVKVDSALTIEKIEDEIDLSFFNSIRGAVMAILGTSGLSPKGEAKAPSSQPAAAGAEA